LDEAEVAGGDVRLDGELQLAGAPVLPPPAQQLPRRPGHCAETAEMNPVTSPSRPSVASTAKSTPLATAPPPSGVASSQPHRTRLWCASTVPVTRNRCPGNCWCTPATISSSSSYPSALNMGST